jgi:hypothetical protein
MLLGKRPLKDLRGEKRYTPPPPKKRQKIDAKNDAIFGSKKTGHKQN